MLVLQSDQDLSLNWILGKNDSGYLETRYVRREIDYFIVYLSSHVGCNQACRFCHLTQTGQTAIRPATPAEINEQISTVLFHYQNIKHEQNEARKIHFNFMARGEPLLPNSALLNYPELQSKIIDHGRRIGLSSRINISTIWPDSLSSNMFVNTFNKDNDTPYFYYSLYSMDSYFRKRWLPKAKDPRYVLDHFANWANGSYKDNFVIHWSFIEGENDSLETLDEIIEHLRIRSLRPQFNVVRYNPYSEAQGKESNEEIIKRNFDYMQSYLQHPKSKIVPRVGSDIYTSCGQFIPESKIISLQE